VKIEIHLLGTGAAFYRERTRDIQWLRRGAARGR